MGAAQYDVTILADDAGRMNEATRALGPLASLKLINLANPPRGPITTARVDLVNIDLASRQSIGMLRTVFTAMPALPLSRIFAVDPTSRRDVVQSHALGATEVLGRPLESRRLAERISHGLALSTPDLPLNADAPAVVAHAGVVLGDLMRATRLDQRLPVAAAERFCGDIVSSIRSRPLSEWITEVRRVHAATFEHCLTVTAVAVGFGHHLGFREADLVLVGGAALVHDVGKAFIPLEVLEKAGPLDATEMRMVRMHPLFGQQVLEKSGAGQAMLDATLNHHEYLDGTGYPNGIAGRQISDLARITTIADVFSALIERRSYKAPMTAGEAFRILESMEGRLDQALVRAFRPVAEGLARIDPGSAASRSRAS